MGHPIAVLARTFNEIVLCRLAWAGLPTGLTQDEMLVYGAQIGAHPPKSVAIPDVSFLSKGPIRWPDPNCTMGIRPVGPPQADLPQFSGGPFRGGRMALVAQTGLPPLADFDRKSISGNRDGKEGQYD